MPVQVPQGWTITVAQPDLFAMYQDMPDIRDDDGELAFYLSARVTTGTLVFGIRTQWDRFRATLRGNKLFALMVAHFQDQGTPITTLQANWDSGVLTGNLDSFNDAVR